MHSDPQLLGLSLQDTFLVALTDSDIGQNKRLLRSLFLRTSYWAKTESQ